MKIKQVFLVSFVCTILCGTTHSQTNLLLNPNADSGTEGWRRDGDAVIEEFRGEKVFVIRDRPNSNGGFSQDVDIDPLGVGKYALFLGRGSSERVNADGAITGLPNLYGYMLSSKSSNGGKINEYLQGQNMLGTSLVPDAWVTMYGIFRIPERTVAIRFFLHQASRKGVPPNGSAARFDDVGLYLFETEKEALEFVKSKSN